MYEAAAMYAGGMMSGGPDSGIGERGGWMYAMRGPVAPPSPPAGQQRMEMPREFYAAAQGLPPLHFGAEDFPALPGMSGAAAAASSSSPAPSAASSGQGAQAQQVPASPSKDMDANAPTFIPHMGKQKQFIPGLLPQFVSASASGGQGGPQQIPGYVAALQAQAGQGGGRGGAMHGVPGSPPPSAVSSFQVQMLLQQQQQQAQLLQQQQKQQQLPQDPKAPKYGMSGLLEVLKMTNPDLNMLALGTDLTSLGLNLNSSNCLHTTFTTPFGKDAVRREPEYHMPLCYLEQLRLKDPEGRVTQFADETLFYVFYSMPREELQTTAARELCSRGWLFHKELRAWLRRVPGTEPRIKDDTRECGAFLIFDANRWELVRRDDFLLFPADAERL